MTCLGMAGGPFLGGILASWWGYRWPFVLVGAMIILITLPILIGVRVRPVDVRPLFRQKLSELFLDFRSEAV